jgi:hypothetical protein
MQALATEGCMTGTRSALLATSLLLTAPAMAAQPAEGGHYVYVPPGATVVLLPAAAPTLPVEFPVVRMMAQQQAMMQRMMADMDALMAMPMPDPQQMIRSVMAGMPQTAPGAGMMLTQIASGAGTCSETVVFGPPGANGQPQVKVTRTGDACAPMAATNEPIGVTQTTPKVMPPATVTPPQDRLWHVGYPARPVTIHTSPRT